MDAPTRMVNRQVGSINWGLVLLTLAAFGPYLSTSIGVRTEQPVFLIAGYCSGLYLLIHHRSGSPSATLASACLVTVLIVGALSSLFPTSALSSQGIVLGSPLAGLVNHLEPITGILIAVWLIERGVPREIIFRSVGSTLVGVMAVNAVIALISVHINLTGELHHFWQATPILSQSDSVALLAQSGGRYTGIFDQPAQAGFLYGLALLLLFYLWDGGSGGRSVRFSLLGLLIVMGGLLTVSKIFILLALPLSGLLFLRRSSRRRLRQIAIIVGTLLVSLVVLNLSGLSGSFFGLAHLEKLFNTSADPLSAVSGGRLGSNGSLGPVFHLVAASSPLTGFGLGGLKNLPSDSVWAEGAITAGYLGVAAYAVLTLVIIYRYLVQRLSDPTNGLMFSLVAFVTVSNLGFPIFTGNRISGLLLLILATLFLTDEPWTGGTSHSEAHQTVLLNGHETASGRL